MAIRLIIAMVLLPSAALAAGQTSSSAANPIRKVVTMLQNMVKKVEAEGEKEKELFDKFMCYCDNADETLGAAIAAADTKMPQLESDIKKAVETKAQLEQDLDAHGTDREAAKEAMSSATEIREKEAAAFAAETGEAKANLEAIAKAVAALEKGMGAGFLQTSVAGVLRKLVMTHADIVDSDRNELVSFLSGSQGDGEDYAPAGGEIVGILKQLSDEMTKDNAETIAKEEEAIVAFDELIVAKKEEVAALTKAIEEKLVRVGELGVEIAMMKNDLEDTQEGHAEDTKFLADLDKNCAAKKKEYDAVCKTRSEELVALADTIKILNDDDALDTFKKNLPSSSFMQLSETSGEVRARALQVIKGWKGHSHGRNSWNMDFIALAIRGKKVGFEKVIVLMDEMVVTLKKEGVDDEKKKEYCVKEFDVSDDKKKELERKVADGEKAIAEVNEGLESVLEEIKALEDGITALDKSVAVATEQRKEENEDYNALMSGNGAAKEIILFAKNRMQKFYNPKLYKPPPAEAPASFLQVSSHSKLKDAPPLSMLAHKKAESSGVLAMMDAMVADIAKEMTQAELEEKDAQGDYEKFMQDSTDKRAGDSKTLTDKGAAKAEMETELQAHTDQKTADEEELTATKQYIMTLHADCDFLMENFDKRKTARAGEIDAIGKAKDVLNGADFSLVQTSVSRIRLHA